MPNDGLRPSPTIYQLDELMRMTFPPPTWAVPGIMARGLCFLCGKPKTGKSFLCINVGLAVAFGGRAFGQVQVERGEVLYLALEDRPDDVQDRVAMIHGDRAYPEGFFVANDWPRMGDGGTQELAEWLEKHPLCRLVEIDTLGKFKPITTRVRSLYDEDYQIAGALKKVADAYNITLLVTHHLRKMDADDVMDTVSGTLGLTGAADETIVLKRQRGSNDAIMHLTGRRLKERELALRFDEHIGSWALLGDAETYRQNKADDEIIKLVNAAEWPLTPTEVQARLPGQKIGTIKWRLWKLSREHKLKALDGKYGPVGVGLDPINMPNPTNRANPSNPVQPQPGLAVGTVGPVGPVGRVGDLHQPAGNGAAPETIPCLYCGAAVLEASGHMACPSCRETRMAALVESDTEEAHR